MMEREYRSRRRERRGRKAPWVLRWLAWTALILIFLAVGYYGSGALLKSMDRRGALPVTGLVSSPDQVKDVLAQNGSQNVTVGKSLDLKIYTLSGGSLAVGNLKLISAHQEADMDRALNTLFLSSSEEWLKNIKVLHLFRNGTSLYIDLPGAFAAGLSELSQENASVLVTGIVRTMVENFPPVKQVTFMVDGKWTQPVNGLALSSAWELGK